MNRALLIISVLIIATAGCEKDPVYDYTQLNQGELFFYNLDLNEDEQSAYIIKQAFHFETSRIVRDSTTNWNTVYYYVPEPEYVGYDYVVIEICTAGTGAECESKELLTFRFEILE